MFRWESREDREKREAKEAEQLGLMDGLEGALLNPGDYPGPAHVVLAYRHGREKAERIIEHIRG